MRIVKLGEAEDEIGACDKGRVGSRVRPGRVRTGLVPGDGRRDWPGQSEALITIA